MRNANHPLFSIVAVCALAVGCKSGGDGHGHDHGDGHGDGDGHGHDHGGGKGHGEGYEHASEHPEGHDHHAAGHGHGDAPVMRITRWSDQLELFAEHPAAVAGTELSVLAHVTVLKDFSAFEGGEVRLELSGPEQLAVTAGKALRPGIYALKLFPRKAGKYTGQLRVKRGELDDAVTGIELEVHADAAAAKASVAPEGDDPHIDFLKEQQWKVPFSTVFAAAGNLQATVEVQGHVETPPGGSAQVGAPIAGRVIAPRGGLPRPGQQVKKGQLLASLAPTPASPETAARAKLAVVEAEARQAAARAAADRAERLMAQQAVSKRELEDAKRELQVADQAIVAAKKADALFSGAKSGRGTGSWRLTAPLAGTVVAVAARPGAAVSPGDELFSLVDTGEMWMKARVPEQLAARLDTGGDPTYRIAGLEQWRSLSLSGDAPSAALVSVSPIVDPRTRTVDVIYSLSSPDPQLRVGGLLRMGLPTGEVWKGLVVPSDAVIDDGGRSVVYVQLDGEHFEERAVRTSARSGNRTGIVSGLEAGERVVVTGANVVRLSSRASEGVGHGHVH